jgi:hypothetical protein
MADRLIRFLGVRSMPRVKAVCGWLAPSPVPLTNLLSRVCPSQRSEH